MQTNHNIPIYRITKDWKGAILSTDLVDYYDVWLEFGEVYKYVNINGGFVKMEIGKGFCILGSELDLSDCYIEFNEKRFDVNNPESFYDRRGNFHHMEFTFK